MGIAEKDFKLPLFDGKITQEEEIALFLAKKLGHLVFGFYDRCSSNVVDGKYSIYGGDAKLELSPPGSFRGQKADHWHLLMRAEKKSPEETEKILDAIVLVLVTFQ